MIACDHIWFLRNKAHHEDLVPNAPTISAHINRLVLEHSSAWKTSLSRSLEVWQRPSSHFIKINYGTAIRDSFSAQATVIWDSTSTLIRHKRNAIDRLFTPSGWITDRNAIGRSFVSQFKSTYTSTNISPTLELLELIQCSILDDDNLFLCAIPTESEIFEALVSLGHLKAPGPDGFTVLFYTKYRDTIKHTVLYAVWNFFQNNQLFRE